MGEAAFRLAFALLGTLAVFAALAFLFVLIDGYAVRWLIISGAAVAIFVFVWCLMLLRVLERKKHE